MSQPASQSSCYDGQIAPLLSYLNFQASTDDARLRTYRVALVGSAYHLGPQATSAAKHPASPQLAAHASSADLLFFTLT